MDPVFLTLAILILLFSVIIHEVMHGLAARFMGDHTAENAGRLTLNPIPHIDPVGTLLLPALLILPSLLSGVAPGFIIGWAKPVPINPFNFKNIRKGELLTSIAGVAANFSVSIVGALLYHLLINLGGNLLVLDLLRFAVTINLVLGIFNILPVPPLDGYKILMSELPLKYSKELAKLEQYGFLIILFLWFVPVGGVPILSLIVGLLVSLINSVLQVPLRLF